MRYLSMGLMHSHFGFATLLILGISLFLPSGGYT